MVWEKIAMCSCPGNRVHGGIGIFPPIKGPFYTDSTQNGINIGGFDGSGGFGGGSGGFNGNGGFGGGGSGSSFGSGGGIIGSNGGFGDNGGFGNGGNNFGMGGNKRLKGMLIEKLKLLIENSDQMILQRKLKEILNEAKDSFEGLQGININSLTDEELLRNFWNIITNKNFHVNQIKGIISYLSTTSNSVGELFTSLFKNITNELGEILNKLSLENLQKLAEAFKQNVNKNLFNDISNINKENLQEKLLEVMNSEEFNNLPLSQAQEPLRNLLNGILENSKTIIDKNELTEAIASLKTSGILSANANVQTSGNEELLKKVKEIVLDKKTSVMKLKNIFMAFIGQKTALQDLIIKITEDMELFNSLLSQIPLEKLKIFTQTVEENSNLEFPEEYKNLNKQGLTNELIAFMQTDEFKSAVEDMNVSDLKDIVQDLLNGLLQTSSDVLSKTYLKNLLERLQEQGLVKSTLNINNLDQNQLLNEVKNVIGSSNVSGSLLKQLVEHISKTIGILQDIGGNVFGNSNQELRQKLIERLKQVIETSNGMIIEKKLKAFLKGLQEASVIDLDINIEELTNAEVLNSFWEIFEISELSTNKINEIVRFLESPIKTIGEFLSSLFENPSDQINDILSYVSLDNLKQIAEGLKQSLNTDMLGDFSGLNKDQLLNKIKNLMETSEFNNMPLSQSQNPLKNIINGVLQENNELLDKNALNELAVNLQGKGLLSNLNLNNLETNNLLLKIKEILEKPDTSIQTLEQIFETLVAQKVMLADFLSQTFQDQEQLNNLLSQISVENIKMFAKTIEEKSNLKLPAGYESLEKEELLKKLSKFTQKSQLINKLENMELNDLKEILEKLLSGLMQTTGDSFDVNYLKTILMEVQKENLVSDKIKLNNLNQDQLLAELKKVIQNPNSPGSLLIKLVEKFSRKKALFLADLDAIHENIPQIINHLPLDTLKSFLKYVEVTANLKVKSDVNALSREEIIQKIISSVQLSDYLEGVIKVPMENVKNAFQNLLTGCFEEATKLLGEKGLSQMIKSLQDANVLDLSQSLNKVGENQMISKIKDLISNPETSLGDLKTIFDSLTNFFENKDFLISSITQILESPSLNANEIPTENLKKVVESIQKVSGEQVSNLNKLNNKELRQQIIDLLEKPEVQNLPLSNLEEILGGIVNTIPGSTLNDDTMKIFKTKLEDILSASGIHLTKDATVPDALKKIFESDDLNDNSKIKFIALFKEILENSGKKWPQDLNDLGNTEVMNLLKKVYESSHSDQESSNSNPFQITNLFDKNNALPSIGSALTDLLGKPKTDLNSLFQSNPQMLQNMQQQLQSTGFGLDDVDSNTGFGLEDFGDTSHSVNTLKEIIFPKAQNGFNTLLSKFPNRALGLKRKTEVRSLEDKTDQSSIVRLAAKKEERDGRKIIIRGTVVIEIPGEGIYRSRRNLGSICDDSWGTNEAIVACKQFAKSEPMLKSSEHTLVIAKAIKGDPSMKEYFTNNLKVVPIMLGSVKCSEDAEDIYFDCDHDAWGEHSCMAYERTAIECHYEKGILEFLS
ncbi:hypothetical protein Avbf_17679 [Armadillidium vulgare]|nr:hypothetical protein Avbf_17679 [Armadillidium vulgare]